MHRRHFLKASALGAGVSLLEACRGEDEQYIVQELRLSGGVLPGQSVWRGSVCEQCSAGCGIVVRVVDGNAKKIEGNADHPVNRGGVCALGHSVLQELYNPDRILSARRRTGVRGDGDFQELPWEEAVAAAALAIDEVPAERIAIIASNSTGLTGALWRRFAESIGAPPPAFLQAPESEVERRGAALALGTEDYPWFDVARADYVLSIGAPFLDRWRSPVHYTGAFADMRRGRAGRRGRLTHAEARMSLTAANADEWLAVRPGSEGTLARTIAGVLLDAGLVSAEGRARYLTLFPEAPPDLAEGAGVCDVRADKIERVALDLASVDAALVIGGGSAAAHTNGLFNVTASLGLNLLLDNLGEAGGVFAPASLRLGDGVDSTDGGNAELSDVAARLRGEGEGVDLLIVGDADPLHASPGGWRLAEGLSGIDQIIALSSFPDDTTLQADLVLPLATELERYNAVEPSIGLPVLGLAEAVVDPMGDGRHPADVILAIASSLTGSVPGEFPWEDFEALVESRIETELARLPGGGGTNARDFVRDALERGGVFERSTLQVPSGPAGQAPAMSEAAYSGDAAEYPFVLVPFESLRTGSGKGANRPWLQEMPDPMSTVMWDSWVEISPSDAEPLGIHDGDRLQVDSPSGSVVVHAVIDPAVRPGVLGMPLGHGHVDYGRYAADRGANAMALVEGTSVIGTAAPAWAANRVRIQRLGDGQLARFGRNYEDRGANEHIPVGWAPHQVPGEPQGELA